MNIEILEFYPIERNEANGFLSGTLRIRLLDLGVDILGVYAVRNKNGYFFNLPRGKSIHHETGGVCFYPFLSFNDKEKQRMIMQEIKVKGQKFIEKRLASGDSIVFPGKPSFNKSQSSTPRTKEIVREAKEIVTDNKPKPVSSIANKVWVDPPPRKIATAHHQRNLGKR